MSFKEVMEVTGYHGLVLLRGFIKTLYGAATSGLIAFAVYGLAAIPTEGGYAAVCDFVTALACLVVAVLCMYTFGCRKQKKVRRWAHG